MGKTTVIYVTFPRDVACQKLLYSANVSRSYSQNNTGTVFLRHGVELCLDRHYSVELGLYFTVLLSGLLSLNLLSMMMMMMGAIQAVPTVPAT